MNRTNHSKTIKKLLIEQFPAFAIIVGLPAINVLIDTIIVSWYLGEEAVAAIGYTSPLVLIIAAVSQILSSGTQVLCGKSLGSGDRQGLNRIFNTVFTFSIVIGSALSVLLICFPEFLSLLLGANGSVTAQTASYIQGFGIGVVFSIISSNLVVFLIFERMEKTAVCITVFSVLVNIVGDVVNAVFLNLGLFGASIFVSVANILSASTALIVLLKKTDLFRFSTKDISRKTGFQILRIGSSSGFDSICHGIGNRIALYFADLTADTTGVAALSVSLSVITVVSCIIDEAFFSIGLSFSSIFAGQKDAHLLKNLNRSMMRISAVLYAVVYTLIFLFAKPIILLFSNGVADILIYVTVLRCVSAFILANCLLIPIRCTYSALNRISVVNVLTFMNGIFFTALSCLSLYKIGGIYGISNSFWISYILTLLLFLIIYICSSHRFPRSFTDLCNIPESLSVSPDDQLSVSLEDIKDAVQASEKVIEFCKRKGYSENKAFACGLCIEEMAVFTVQNRFDKQKSVIDLYVYYENGHFMIMLRDDCPYFSPKEWIKLCKPDEYERSIGIRMTYEIAEDINYVNSLGINLLTIRI